MAVYDSQAGTLLGPLTTAWSTVFIPSCSTCDPVAWNGQQCTGGQPEDHTSCWPPTTSGAGTRTPPFAGWGFYSQYGKRADWSIEFTLLPGETAVGCCPVGFGCTNQNGNTCYSTMATNTQATIPTGVCSGDQVVSTTLAVFPQGFTTTSAVSGAGTSSVTVITTTRVTTLYAPMFQLNYQSTDLSKTTIATLSSLTDAPNNTTPSSPSSITATSSPESVSNYGGLSTGAVAGIGVGSALAGIVLAAAAGFWLFRKRRQREADQAKGQPDAWQYQEQTWGQGELAGWRGSSEFKVQSPVELPTAR
ncbi:hypothetical protein QBC46DRAFT_462283 [Diplogelasinospora grovesii]|uniref:Uncharacterized protein n=1 Tax=Diplogelasinospora grovesii TaxID=303347 RepID=A0AAN6RYZ9_9PEZI|nr:hypothetical protein QBC46DRAFT_462283 [Diplogelasinospora grovesii]